MRDSLAFPPARGVRGAVTAPPSKSATNRALVLAALSSEPVELVAPLDSEDTRSLAACLEAMGAKVAATPRGLSVGGPLGRSPGGAEILLDAGASGTAARFLAAVAAAVPGRYRLTGAPRLRERPMAELVRALRSRGASIEASAGEFLPLVIEGGTLQPGVVEVDATRSSQFVSALLLAGVAVEGGLSVLPKGAAVSAPYVETTIETLAAFGHGARRDAGGAITVSRGSGSPRSFPVPGDWSSALNFLAAAGIAGGEVELTGLSWPSPDADARAVAVVQAMGVSAGRLGSSFRARGPSGPLRPVSVSARDFPDAVPALAALAAHAEGESRFRDVAHLANKESDRLAALARILEAAGASARAGMDELVVVGPRRPLPGVPRLPTFDDHRMAMAAALLSLRSPGALIENPRCVAKSYPTFFGDLETILLRE
jgi:3-phosphoshikimate 1-carboxyvinyltransferase